MATAPTSEDQPPPRSAWPLCALGVVVNLPLLAGFALTAWSWLAGHPLSNLGAISLTAGVMVAFLGNAMIQCRLNRAHGESESAHAVTVVHREQLECILESLPDAVLSVDEAGTIRSCNTAGLKLFGYKPGDLVGKRLGRLLPEEATRRTKEVKTDEQRTLGAGQTIEARRRDGSHFPAALIVAKSRPGHGALYTVVVRDLTEINQTRHAAAAADRSKHSFLGRISHELRTPLAGVLGMVEVLRHTPLSSEQSERLDTIQESAEGLLAIFDQMIDHARLEAGQIRLNRHPFSLRQVVERTLAPLREQAESKGLSVTIDVASRLPDALVGDPGRLGQILANLADNAIKFTCRGEVIVRVREASIGVEPSAALALPLGPTQLMAAPRSPGLHVQFEVCDTGIGLPAEAGRLFDPFEQGDNSSARSFGGVGLGLTVAAQLVSLMGGTIEAESRSSAGTVFRFQVPLESSQEYLNPASLPPILIVMACDDDRVALERHLAGWGITAVGAGNGREALTELLRAVVVGTAFGLVAIEEHLPDLSAREVMQRLRDRSDNPPPVVMFGLSENDLPPPDGVCAVLPRDPAHPQFRRILERVLRDRLAALV